MAQEILVHGITLATLAVLLAAHLRHKKQGKPGCVGCNNCTAKPAPAQTFVPLTIGISRPPSRG